MFNSMEEIDIYFMHMPSSDPRHASHYPETKEGLSNWMKANEAPLRQYATYLECSYDEYVTFSLEEYEYVTQLRALGYDMEVVFSALDN